MLTINNLSLRIYGGAADTGLNNQPIVAVGNVPDGFTPMSPALIDEQQVWMITHAQNYTLYATYSKRCRTADDKIGLMLFCLFFPPQKRLADGNSPLGLLDSIMDFFVVQALRDGKLPNASVDNTQFKTLLAKYRLEDRPMPLPIMQGHEPAAFCVENKTQLDALMRHSRYQILSAVGRLELGYHCKSTISLLTTGSPRKEREPVAPVVESQVDEGPAKEPVMQTVISDTGGMFLDDGPIEEKTKPWYKKLLKVVAIIFGVIFGLFFMLVLIGMCSHSNGNNYQEAEEFIEAADSIPYEEEIPDSVVVEYTEKVNQPENENTSEDSEDSFVEVKEDETTESKADMPKENDQSKDWQAKIRSFAQECPIPLRVGVRITSIIFTETSVTYNVSYEEKTKYDMSSSDRDELAADRSAILNEYGAGLPSGITRSVIQKDKAGRVF